MLPALLLFLEITEVDIANLQAEAQLLDSGHCSGLLNNAFTSTIIAATTTTTIITTSAATTAQQHRCSDCHCVIEKIDLYFRNWITKRLIKPINYVAVKTRV